MSIPNTTPTPNELYNGEMKKMSDTELRIVLVVTRATLGWVLDEKTGKRKEEDWISYYQLKQKTGRGFTAIAKAIDNCIKSGWIEARDEAGELLDSKNKRIGKKIFYRLGFIFLSKISTSSESEDLSPTSSESEITESEITESEAYKRNSITKETLLQKKERYSNLSDLTEKDFGEISSRYKVPIAFVRSKFDDMVLWAGGKLNNPKARGRNWRLTLMAWVKKDAIKIAEGRWKDDKKTAIDASHLV